MTVSDTHRIGDFCLQWGESLRWDDQRERLYFVDCAARTLHWLDDARAPLQTLPLPGLPTGVVLTQDERLVIALDDGLHAVDPDRRTVELLAAYPQDLGLRANDAHADLDGNLVTGTLNLAPGPGSCWWYSSREGWRLLDDEIGNVNGPVVTDIAGRSMLVVADTHSGLLHAYEYEGRTGTVGERWVFADTAALGGMPDGACADDQGGIWSCVLGGGKIARHTVDGSQRVLDAGVEQPSDLAFGGAHLDRLFFVSVALPIRGIEVRSPHAGSLMVAEDTGARGRPEPRFRL